MDLAPPLGSADPSLQSSNPADLPESSSNMTLRYTNAEWSALIKDVEKRLVVSKELHPSPALGSTEFAKTIDHTLLKLDATQSQIDGICSEARRENFKCVCVRLKFVARAVSDLKGTDIGVACVVGFHEGTQDLYEKLVEAESAVAAGASELDIVLNWPQLLKSSYEEIYSELAALRSACPHPTRLKLIFETSQLQPHHIIAACILASAARFDYVKTSTGFCGRGASLDDISLMSAVLRHLRRMAREEGWLLGATHMGIKASGGIRGMKDAIVMLEAGATRIGTSSGVWICQEARAVIEERNKWNGLRSLERPGNGLSRMYTDNSNAGY